MDFSEIENAHYKLQIGMYFSGSKKMDGALLMYSDTIKDLYWNYATKVNTTLDKFEELVSEIESFYKSKNRAPAFYVTHNTFPKELPSIVENKGYKLASTESWMVYEGQKQEISPDVKIEKVSSEEQMKFFSELFHECYSDPDDPYGVLPPYYSETLYQSFFNKDPEKEIYHYMGSMNSENVGVSSLILNENYAGIYNIGTLPNTRKKGIGKAMTYCCVNKALEDKERVIFLQTEKNSYNEKLYTKFGFKTQFIGTCYTKPI